MNWQILRYDKNCALLFQTIAKLLWIIMVQNILQYKQTGLRSRKRDKHALKIHLQLYDKQKLWDCINLTILLVK